MDYAHVMAALNIAAPRRFCSVDISPDDRSFCAVTHTSGTTCGVVLWAIAGGVSHDQIAKGVV